MKNSPIDATGPDDPDALLELATRVAREAGALALTGRRGSVLERDTKSSTTDLVTQHDRAAEALIVGQLRTERPTDAIVGEEGATLDGTSGYAWFLDPIDGTTNFVYDLPAVVHLGRRRVPRLDRRRGGLRPRRRRDVRRPAGRRRDARRHADPVQRRDRPVAGARRHRLLVRSGRGARRAGGGDRPADRRDP